MPRSLSDPRPPFASMSSSGLTDGLGRRWLAFDREEGAMLERLVVRPELAAFEGLLRDRVDRLAVLDDERIARPRTLIREANGSLVAVSEFVPGTRLSEILEAGMDGAAPGVDAALGFLLDVLPALCCLHAGAGFAHGTIAPSRIVATPAGQIVLLDAVYGEGLSRLRFSRRRLWTEFGLAVRPVSGPAALDARTDLAQTALAGVMLILGRQVVLQDLVDGLTGVLGEMNDVARISTTDAFAQALCQFFERTLPFFAGTPFETADDALIEVRELAAAISSPSQCQTALHEFVSRLVAGNDIQAGEGMLDAADPFEDGTHDQEGAFLDAVTDEDVGHADEIVDEEIDLDALEDDEPYTLEEPLSLEQPFGLDAFSPRGDGGVPHELPCAQPSSIDGLRDAHPEPAAFDSAPASPVTGDRSDPDDDEWIRIAEQLAAAVTPISAPRPDAGRELHPENNDHPAQMAPAVPDFHDGPVPLTEADPVTDAVHPLETAPAGRVDRTDADRLPGPVPEAGALQATSRQPPEPAHQSEPVPHEPERADAPPEGPQRAETATAPSSAAASPPDGIREVRARRARKSRSARARKDRLRSARGTLPAAEPPPPSPPAPKAPGGGWLVRPDRVPVFDPAPESPEPQSQIVPFPVPAPSPAPLRLAAQATAAPPPPAVLYPPAPSPAAVPAAAFPQPLAPPPPPVIPPLYGTPWTTPLPTPVDVTGAVGTLKLKTPAKAGRASRPRPADDIYGTPVSPPRVEPPPHFPWKLAAAVVAVILVAVIAGRAYMPARSVVEDGSAAAAAIAAAAEAAPPFVPPAAPTGRLEVETQPAGARVLLNGKPAGQTPLTLQGVPAGRHTVTLVTGSGSVRRTVRVEADRTARLDVPIFSGWVAVFAPFTVEVRAGGRVVGTTEDPRILLSPGRHELTLSNRELGYRAVQTVEIEPGQVRTITLDPRGSASVNASPWAEVWIDGEKAGDTPLANLKLPLGTREVVFRHPQLGERRTTVTIKANAPAAVSMDMSSR